VEVASNKTSTNQDVRGGGRRGIPSERPEDQQGTAGGGDRRRKTESERGEKKGRTRAMEARMGGNPSAHLPRALLCLHRAISRASPKSSRQAPSRPDWRGKLARGGRPRPGWQRGNARGGAGKWCESGNQTWVSSTASSRMGLWTASCGQPITPFVPWIMTWCACSVSIPQIVQSKS
jgi:hypothetical protein